jgi:hypothetical protein
VAQALGGLPTRQRIDLRGAGAVEGPQVVVVLGKDYEPFGVPDLRGVPAPSANPGVEVTPSPVPTPEKPQYKGIPTGDEAC